MEFYGGQPQASRSNPPGGDPFFGLSNTMPTRNPANNPNNNDLFADLVMTRVASTPALTSKQMAGPGGGANKK